MVVGRDSRQRPRIHFYFHPQVAESLIDSIAAGIEEEGVPYWREARDQGDAVTLAYTAAQESHLGVGLGLEADGLLVLHYERLQPGHPLYQGRVGNRPLTGRHVGSNAARLVKGIPFKPWVEEDARTISPPATALPAGETLDPLLIKRVVEVLLGHDITPRR